MAATRTKENSDSFNFFKTPLRTPLRTPIHGMLSSVTLNDLPSYSSKKLSKFSSNNDVYNNNNNRTPLRTPATTTPLSSSRRALASINHNTPFSMNDFFLSSSSDSSVSLSAPMKKQQQSTSNTTQQVDDDENVLLDPNDCDLSHKCPREEDTFDDLIPEYERIERILPLFQGVNISNYNIYDENSIRGLPSPTLLASKERIFDGSDDNNNTIIDLDCDIGLIDVGHFDDDE
ncbi:unnamed protein product [Didymodactylos carnosus]|uniref:Uncharacterized protein n=1 Tax=Didymodactylos carnosus TaxID=1234261 RepID=A0A813WWK0_9BILA|nr:unnamed protein product [Didymodactylos carnosus]CAF1250428.1 unnamed protein product [Didymodactylos carnosus]CAF3648576.1 unnamed protein product [Didymodactylos carnosus]CAF4057884.1 unnamed protein product [Didymodactylos carnosus]